MSEIKDKRELSVEEIKEIINLINNEKFTESVDEDCDQLTSITVTEDEEECVASYCIDEDSCRNGLSFGLAYHTLVVGKYTIIATETEDGIDEIYAPKDADYRLPYEKDSLDDDDLMTELADSISLNWDTCIYERDVNEQFEHDWTPEEVEDEILSQLEYETYVEIDDTIHFVEDDDVDAYIEEYCDSEGCGEPEYTVLTKSEVASILAENIDFNC